MPWPLVNYNLSEKNLTDVVWCSQIDLSSWVSSYFSIPIQFLILLCFLIFPICCNEFSNFTMKLSRSWRPKDSWPLRVRCLYKGSKEYPSSPENKCILEKLFCLGFSWTPYLGFGWIWCKRIVSATMVDARPHKIPQDIFVHAVLGQDGFFWKHVQSISRGQIILLLLWIWTVWFTDAACHQPCVCFPSARQTWTSHCFRLVCQPAVSTSERFGFRFWAMLGGIGWAAREEYCDEKTGREVMKTMCIYKCIF